MKFIKNADGTVQLPMHRYSWRKPAWPAFARYLASTNRPIFVGPWRGEIGFEALYWIPFLHHFLAQYQIDPARIIPISRGGASAWYGVPQGLELYAMRTPQELRVRAREDVARTGVFKQTTVTAFDQDIIRDAAQTLGHRSYHVLHPAWMYHTLASYWTGRHGVEWVGKRLQFQPITPAATVTAALPAQYLVARFYSRQTFPGNHKLVPQFVQASLQQMTNEQDVVLCDHGLYLDDHSDITRGITGPRLHHLSDLVKVTPENNLAVQSAVLANALGFVGTYGGFAQLALRMGKPSVSFYLDWGNATSFQHRALADILSLRTNVPALVLRVGELPMLQTVTPLMAIKAPEATRTLATATGSTPLAPQPVSA